MDEIVVSEGLVLAATVILGFIINQGLAWAGLELSVAVRKGIVYAVAVGLSGFAMYQAGLPSLPDPLIDPSAFALALLSVATLNFKAAQAVYDRIWQGLLSA